MKSRDEVYDKVAGILAELFEIEPDEISPQARLYEDLDIDSIDAVDLLVELKTYTGRKLAPEDFKSVRTVTDVVDSVCALLESE